MVAELAAILVLAAAPARLEVELGPPERAAAVARVLALDRSVPQQMIDQEVRIRAVEARPAPGAAGKWVIEGLEPGGYDLCVETKAGKFEGYALRPEERSDEKLTDEDGRKIREIVAGMHTFEEEKRVLDLGGNRRQAVALVELVRRGKTSLRPGVVTWRMELWRFDRLYGVWRRGEPKVLRRFLVGSAEEFAGYNWNFVPELGGLELKARQTHTLKWTLPEGFDPARGRAAAPAPAPAPQEAEKPPAATAPRPEAAKPPPPGLPGKLTRRVRQGLDAKQKELERMADELDEDGGQ